MENADHDLALESFQAMHSVLWRIVTVMDQLSEAPFDERLSEEINYSAIEAEVQPQLNLLHGALQRFPKQSFDSWKERVLQDLSDDPFDCTGAANWIVLENQPQGVALSCDRAWTKTNDELNDILLRLGARGWPGILSAWESIRDKLYVVDHHLRSALEQLTMNPMFAVYLRERALRMINDAPADVNSDATTGDDADSSECKTAAEPCTGVAEVNVIDSATLGSDLSSVKTVSFSDAVAVADVEAKEEAANAVVAEAAIDDDDDQDGTATNDLSAIPGQYRTRPIGKAEAAAWLGKVGDAGRRWLNKCISDESIACVKMTRQSYIFDLRDFPEAAIFRLRPREPDDGNNPSPLVSAPLSPTNSDPHGTTPQ